jgi:hypothetical protein
MAWVVPGEAARNSPSQTSSSAGKGTEMHSKVNRRWVVAIMALLVLGTVAIHAQVKRPFRNGSVWSIAFVKVQAGMDTAYLNYLSGQWKAEQEALKKEGMILSYKVLTTEGHGSTDWNLMLLTEYKDLATMEAGEAKADALAQKVVGDDQKQMAGYKERSEIREIVGSRLAREIVLEPKP